jgi:hypothetical protein
MAVNLSSDCVLALRQPSEKLLQGLETRQLLSLRRVGLSLGFFLCLCCRLGLGPSLYTLFFLCLTSGLYGALSGPLLFLVGRAKPA